MREVKTENSITVYDDKDRIVYHEDEHNEGLFIEYQEDEEDDEEWVGRVFRRKGI